VGRGGRRPARDLARDGRPALAVRQDLAVLRDDAPHPTGSPVEKTRPAREARPSPFSLLGMEHRARGQGRDGTGPGNRIHLHLPPDRPLGLPEGPRCGIETQAIRRARPMSRRTSRRLTIGADGLEGRALMSTMSPAGLTGPAEVRSVDPRPEPWRQTALSI